MKVQLVVAFVFCKKDKEDRTRNYLQIFPATAILNFSLNDSLMSKDRIRCIDFKCPCEVHILLYKSEPSLSVQSSKSIFFLICLSSHYRVVHVLGGSQSLDRNILYWIMLACSRNIIRLQSSIVSCPCHYVQNYIYWTKVSFQNNFWEGTKIKERERLKIQISEKTIFLQFRPVI